jgi:hypothetical protein
MTKSGAGSKENEGFLYHQFEPDRSQLGRDIARHLD